MSRHGKASNARNVGRTKCAGSKEENEDVASTIFPHYQQSGLYALISHKIALKTDSSRARSFTLLVPTHSYGHLTSLQAAAVHDLVVDSQLPAFVVDDEDTNAATAVGEAVSQTVEQVALVKDWQTLLDITSLGHGNHTAIIPQVKDAVLLEDRAKHVLHNDARARVRDERALLVQLLSEEVYTEVTVLAGLSRGGDTDDLARAALQDEQVANANVVARDGNGVWWSGWAATHDTLAAVTWGGHGDFAVLDNDVLVTLYRRVCWVVVLVLFAVEDAVGGSVQTVTEAVVLAVFVVISHVKAVLALSRAGCWVYRLSGNPVAVVVEVNRLTLCVTCSGRVVARLSALTLPTTVLAVVLLRVRLGS